MNSCILCHSAALKHLGQIQHGMTSDSKVYSYPIDIFMCENCSHIQKNIDDKLKSRLDNIYKTYSVNFSDNIQEQMLFENGIIMPRSQSIAKKIIENLKLANTGNLLDFGCGNGNFLKQFNILMPEWRLSGFDIIEHFEKNISSIKNIDAFYSSIEKIKNKFNLITLNDVFEHVPNPIELISKLKSILTQNGKIFIKSPYFINNIYDLAIIDHYSHFNIKSLRKITNKDISVYNKDIIIISGNDYISNHIQKKEENNIEQICISAVHKLNDINNKINNFSTPIAIYGTSVVATYVAGINKDKVKCFVDDDILRQGETHLEIPIVPLIDTPKDLPIVLAFPEKQSQKVYRNAIKYYPSHNFIFI